jgi:hypothetical protein
MTVAAEYPADALQQSLGAASGVIASATKAADSRRGPNGAPPNHRAGLSTGSRRMCSYFFTSETATHFGGVPESICPEGHGSVGFAAVEGGALEVLGADGAAGMVCEPVVLDDEDEDLF